MDKDKRMTDERLADIEHVSKTWRTWGAKELLLALKAEREYSGKLVAAIRYHQAYDDPSIVDDELYDVLAE
jgi:hypothetical protein